MLFRRFYPGKSLRRVGAAFLVAGVLAGCQADEYGFGPKAERPVSDSIRRKMTSEDMSLNSPIMIRIFKEENVLEVWKQKRNGKYSKLEEFEICSWSGKLGPKIKEGDRQAPEGFYEITPGLMNPNSSYYLAFNMGFPNTYDRSNGRTGSNLMVHGACSSRGCYAMTDEQVQQIYALARDSFKGGQRSFQVQAFPFRMTPENMARHHDSEHMDFWRMLKVGYDHFEVSKVPPQVSVCEKKYVFDATPLVDGVPFRASMKCPEYAVAPNLAQAVEQKERVDDQKFEQIVAKLEAREARKQRAEERQQAIASFFGSEQNEAPAAAEGGEATVANTDTGSSPAPGAITPTAKRPGAAVETAYATPPAEEGQGSTGGFFKRFLSFGSNSDDGPPSPEVGQIDTDVVPAAKP